MQLLQCWYDLPSEESHALLGGFHWHTAILEDEHNFRSPERLSQLFGLGDHLVRCSPGMLPDERAAENFDVFVERIVIAP